MQLESKKWEQIIFCRHFTASVVTGGKKIKDCGFQIIHQMVLDALK